jgi:hypothetical protein
MYLAESSSLPCHTMGLATAGASLSGKDSVEDVLCKLSFEDFALSVWVDIVEDCILFMLVVEDLLLV